MTTRPYTSRIIFSLLRRGLIGRVLAAGITVICVVSVGLVSAQGPPIFPNQTTISLVEHPGADTVDVNLVCDHPSCDAVSLAITFDPAAIQVLILSEGDFQFVANNPMHILREHVDNEQGLVEFTSVTENQGGIPFSGTRTLLTLAIIHLSEAAPRLELVAAEVASLEGATVFRYAAELQPTPTPAPTATAPPQAAIVQVQLESAPPDGITAQLLNNARVVVAPGTPVGDQVVFEIDLDPAASDPAQDVVVFDAPAHLACSVNLDQPGYVDAVTLLAGDVNADGVIDINDTAVIGLSMGTGQLIGDVNFDNRIDILDLIHVGRNYGARTGACTP